MFIHHPVYRFEYETFFLDISRLCWLLAHDDKYSDLSDEVRSELIKFGDSSSVMASKFARK